MHIEVSYRDIARKPSIDAHITRTLADFEQRFAGRITRVEVHVGDHNGPKSGPGDKRVMIEARLARMSPIAVEAEGEKLDSVISKAARKLERAIEHRIERREDRRSDRRRSRLAA